MPCGLPDFGVTSLSDLAGRPVTVEELRPLVERHAAEVFGVRLSPVPPDVAMPDAVVPVVAG